MTTFDHMAYLDAVAASVRESLEIGQRLDAVEIEHSRSLHPSTAVGFDELRPGMGVYRWGDVWIVVTKRSDGFLHMRQEGTDHYEWVEAAGETFHLAGPF